MTTTEFSTQFDILFNNIMSDTAPGINEYEKSVFLTKAQNEIVKNYFNPKGNKYQEGFDGSAKRQSDFSNLITIVNQNAEADASLTFYREDDDYSGIFKIPDNLMLYIQEALRVKRGEQTHVLQVIPIRYDEYLRMMSRPFKYPPRDQAWRVIGNQYISTDAGSASRTAQLIFHPGETLDTNQPYNIVYVRRPNPIIIAELGNLTIDGKHEVTECELFEEIHPEILQRAVELAKATYSGDINATIEMGKRSE